MSRVALARPLPTLSGGLIEGIAERGQPASDPDEDATIHEQARAMIEAGLAPPLASVVGAGFSTLAGRRALHDRGIVLVVPARHARRGRAARAVRSAATSATSTACRWRTSRPSGASFSTSSR
jgi:hypothetical protein